MRNWSLWGTIQIIGTRQGLRKKERGSCAFMGDGLVKIKVDPAEKALEKIDTLYHEFTHLICNIYRSSLNINKNQEEKMAKRAGETALIFKEYLKHEKI